MVASRNILFRTPRGQLLRNKRITPVTNIAELVEYVLLGALSIDNERDDDASQTRQTGSRASFSARKTKFKQSSFPERRRLFLFEKVCLVAVLLWHSRTSVIYILWAMTMVLSTVANLLFFTTLEAFSLLRSFCFCFEVKIEHRSRTALDLQLP